MKDIKTLYLAAKSSGKQSDVTAYTEAVKELLESKPIDFLSNLEYIISSDIGLTRLNEFVEKWGLSIAAYDPIMECLQSCIEKCEQRHIDSSLYQEYVDKFEMFRHQYAECFNMFKYYADDDLYDGYFEEKSHQEKEINSIYRKFDKAYKHSHLIDEYDNEISDLKDALKNKTLSNDEKKALKKRIEELEDKKKKSKEKVSKNIKKYNKGAKKYNSKYILDINSSKKEKGKEFKEAYLQTYYSLNANGVQNRKLIVGMVEKFGEAAIADALITANQMGPKAVDQTMNFLIEELNECDDFNLLQFISEACGNINIPDNHVDFVTEMKEYTLESLVESINERCNTFYRESMIMGNTDAVMEFTEEEIDHIKDLIAYKEYMITCAESTDKALSLQNEVYSLYEKFADVLEEDTADEILPMLPQPNGGNPKAIEEDMSWRNTRNKKTGQAPAYLSTNHDLGYGEDEPSNNPPSSGELELDDFKRASATTDDPSAIADISNDDSELDSDPEVGANLTPEDKAAVNNYYYYTYNNSMNKNSNSFNKDVHNDNSVDNSRKTDDHSVDFDNSRRSDDHSVGKHINSHNDNTDDHSDRSSDKGDNRDNSIQNESFGMVELDLGLDKSFFLDGVTEAVGDADDQKPESDHPVKDTLQDIDRGLTKQQQKIKKGVQNVQNVGRAAKKPYDRAKGWVTGIVNDWKDKDETKIKEKMADPKARRNIFSAIAWSIKAGSFAKAGLLLNPIFLFLTITKKVSNNKNAMRIRNEMIGELKTELEVIDEKIKDADDKGDNKAKYQLMRLRNEINKKLVRVGGSVANKKWTKKGELL